jgi:hypothetical protein
MKNTSARAITFNQFEQTKNNLKLGLHSEVTGGNEASSANGNPDLDQSNKMKERLNASNIELITGATELASA